MNKPKRVTMKTATVIDHLVCLSLPLSSIAKPENETNFIYKRTFSPDSTEVFKQKLHEINWKEVETNQNPNEAY